MFEDGKGFARQGGLANVYSRRVDEDDISRDHITSAETDNVARYKISSWDFDIASITDHGDVVVDKFHELIHRDIILDFLPESQSDRERNHDHKDDECRSLPGRNRDDGQHCQERVERIGETCKEYTPPMSGLRTR